MAKLIYNGEMVEATQPLFGAGHPAFRWGAGIFETMRVHRGRVPLLRYHVQRAREAVQWLALRPHPHLEEEALLARISALCAANDPAGDVRVRLTVMEEAPGTAGYCIEAMPYAATEGLKTFPVVDYPHFRKPADAFSRWKTTSYLPYLQARRHAEANGAGECILWNAAGRAAEGSHTNLFIVRSGTIYTPPLEEGCVDGVMRKYLLEQRAVQVVPLTRDMVEGADEIFFSNALAGLRAAAAYQGRKPDAAVAHQIYQDVIRPLWG